MSTEHIPIEHYNKILEGKSLEHRYHIAQVKDSNASIISSLQALQIEDKKCIKQLEKRLARKKKA